MKKNKMHTLSEKWLVFFAVVSLTLVCLIRFNGNQLFIHQQPYDAKYFNAYVSYFRGEKPVEPIRPMSNWRFLLPLVASKLPFSAPTSLNLINLLCLAACLICLYYTLNTIGVSKENRWIAIALFIFSFPMIYYSCISYVDPGSIFFISLGIYFWVNENIWGFAFALLIGLMAKEIVILLLPFAGIYALAKKDIRTLFFLLLLALLFFIEIYWIRRLAPLTEGEEKLRFWKISFESFQMNLHRWHTWGAFFFSFGIVGLLLIFKLFRNFKSILHKPLSLASLAGILSSIALFIYSFITTVADGRIIWHSYFFMLLIIFEPNLKTEKIEAKS